MTPPVVPPPPPPPPPPRVVQVELNVPGTLVLGDSLVARAIGRDSLGREVTQPTITWSTSDPAVLTVSTTGVVRGTTSGIATVRATIGTESASSRVCVRGGAPRGVVLLGDAQRAEVQSVVGVLPVVRVEDIAGRTIPCLGVRLKVLPSGGAVEPDTATTDASGLVRVTSWRFSTAAGPQAVQVFAADTLLATVQATATPGPPASVEVASGDAEFATVGRPFSQPLVARVRDRFGNVVPGAVVTFRRRDGVAVTLTTPNAVTDTAGVARTPLSVDAIGEAHVEATAPGATAAVFSVAATGLRAKRLLSAVSRACALGFDDVWYCWGEGMGTASSPLIGTTPTQLQGSHGLTQLTGGLYQVCAVKADATAWCWGTANSRGRFTTPQPALVASDVDRIFPGNGYTCVLQRTGPTMCWGKNQYGEVGAGFATIPDVGAPIAVSGGHRFTEMAGSLQSPCALANGVAYCWGYNGFGWIGDGTTTDRFLPTLVQTSTRFTSIINSCGLTAIGEAWCWGYNYWGQVGDGTSTHRLTPVRVSGNYRFTRLEGGFNHNCGLTATAEVLCWGGIPVESGVFMQQMIPALVSGTMPVTDMIVGFNFTCAIGKRAQVYCWGDNFYGNLGDGTRTFREAPTPVLPPSS